MRISTSTIFDAGISRINDQQAALVKTQQQLATGKRILSPSDDPVAAARALDVSQGKAVNAQLATNRQVATEALSHEDSVLGSVTTLLQNIKDIAVNAGNPTLGDTQRQYLATELDGYLQELTGLANTRDAMGNYIFSGYNVRAQPFQTVTGGANYVGDQGQRTLQVGPSRELPMADTGDAIFQNIRTGNGIFVTSAASTVSGGVVTPTNTGSGIISPGSVVNQAALTGNSYSIVFNVAGGTTTYDIVNTTTSTTVSAGNAYTSGQAIAFAGMQVEVQGSPANGDSFNVQPSTNQSIFTTVTNLINALKAPATGSTGQANLTNNLNSAMTGIDNSLDNVLTVRASVGARLKEIDELNNLGDSLDLQYTSTLSDLQDLDYAQAITQLNSQQVILEAAQKSFMKISGLSLFNLL